jgi:two-component system chemotaxis response regulator CheB
MVRVLIADDSKLVRAVLRDLLARDSAIQIIGEVGDGLQAVTETSRLRPDLIIMDVHMPVMDGLEAIQEIMATCPTPILVLSATVDPKDSRSAFNAIRHGALDVLTKPQGGGESFEKIAGQLIETVKSLARVRVIHHYRRRRESLPPRVNAGGNQRDILAIGASTGGPPAILRLLKEIPAASGARVLIVQHIAEGFVAGFVEWLNRETTLSVRLAGAGDPLEAGVALVAPSGSHLQVREERVFLSPAPPVNSCRPAVDVLFHSLADSSLASRTAAVLLTGMGRDGAEGLAALRRAGAHTIAQDENSSVIFGMPKAAIDIGAAVQILPLTEIPPVLLSLLRPL